MPFELADLHVRLIQAPMAGGPTTPHSPLQSAERAPWAS